MNIEKYKQTLTLSSSTIDHNLKEFLTDMPNYIRQNSVYKKFKAKEVLFEKSEEYKYVYYIISGSFVVVNEFESGRIYEPVILYSDDFIGVVEAIVKKQEIISTIIANEQSEVLGFRKDDFIKWIGENHNITKIVLNSISISFTKNMVESGEQIILNTRYLLLSHLIQQSVMKDDIFLLDESREKTSIRTGINIRTLYRHIKELKQKGLVDTRGRKVFFNDSQRQNIFDLMTELRNK